MRPLIGITCDVEDKLNRNVPTRHDILQHYYSAAVTKAGGLPVLLPPGTPELAREYLPHLKGLVLSGGDFDLDPALYSEPRHEKLGQVSPTRTDFEMILLREAEALLLPILGICGGLQLMNVARGGTLYQDLPSQRPEAQAHSQKHDKREGAHRVTFEHDTFIGWYGASSTQVNSTHHQAVKQLGKGLVVTGRDDEQLVEAFMDPAKPFFVGVQWHPEALHHEHGLVPYRQLVLAAKK